MPIAQRRAASLEIGTGALDGLARTDRPDSRVNAIAWLEDGRDDVSSPGAFSLSDYTTRWPMR